MPAGPGFRRSPLAVTALVSLLLAAGASAGDSSPRILRQDPALDNLVDPPGYATAPLGSLGAVKAAGSGAQAMLLIPGLGFGGEVFEELMQRWGERYRMQAVTLAGFAGTPAPPSPGKEVSFGDQTWTHGALAGLEELLAREPPARPIVVGHWLTGTQLALRLAMRHPESIRAVVLLAGSARLGPMESSRQPPFPPLAQRVAGVDRFLAPRWFATVTRETWDDNNFLPGDYALHPVRGLRLWRQAANAPLHVWVRYLCEYHAQDVAAELDRVKVPVLVVLPGLDGVFHEPGSNYMRAFTHGGWEGPRAENPGLRFVTLPESRALPWFDQPEALEAAVDDFLRAVQ